MKPTVSSGEVITSTEKRREPFFIVGFSRSGTTLLASLLNRHSRICVTPETRFCRGVMPCGRPDRRARSHEFITNRLFSYWRTSDLKIPKEAFYEKFQAFEPSYKAAFTCLLDLYRSKAGKQIVGEKSPIHLLYLPLILRWFPVAQVFCIIRDGRDVVESMKRAPFTHNNLFRHAAEWAYQSSWAKSMEERFPQQVQVVRFEDLVLRPDRVINRICNLLGFEFESNQLLPEQASELVPDWETRWKHKALSAIDRQNIYNWKDTPASFSSNLQTTIMKDELLKRGYEVPIYFDRSFQFRTIAAILVYPFRGRAYELFRQLSHATRQLLCWLKIKDYK